MSEKATSGSGSKARGRKPSAAKGASRVTLTLEAGEAGAISKSLATGLLFVTGKTVSLELPESTARALDRKLSAGIQASEKRSGAKSGSRKGSVGKTGGK